VEECHRRAAVACSGIAKALNDDDDNDETMDTSCVYYLLAKAGL
jgi:hypothetical protein